MRHWVLLIILAVTVAVIAYLTVWVFTGNDDGLEAQEPDGRAVPLPGTRPLTESDITALRFDTTLRGYRMVQVDSALRRAAYDLGYKQELIDVLEAEVQALREGRLADAEELRHAREGAASATATAAPGKPVAEAWSAGADSGGTATAESTRIMAEVHEPDEAESTGPESTEPEAAEPESIEPEAAEPQASQPEAAGDAPGAADAEASDERVAEAERAGDATDVDAADDGAVERAAGRR